MLSKEGKVDLNKTCNLKLNTNVFISQNITLFTNIVTKVKFTKEYWWISIEERCKTFVIIDPLKAFLFHQLDA